MANLTYNTNIFTNVNKYDNVHNYKGIFVTGKFNQKNGQDFKILDAIDIDWNGAYVRNLNTYLNTTEDVVNAFNLLGQNTININNYLNDNFITFSYLTSYHYTKNETNKIVNDKAEEVTNTILGPVNESFNTLYKISQWIIDKSRYIKTDYINMIENGKVIEGKEYYIYLGDNQYQKVNNEYILSHPNDEYYEFMFSDVIDLASDITELRLKVGDAIYSQVTNKYTYSGLYHNIHILDENIVLLSQEIDNINDNIDDIENKLNTTYELADNSYWLAYNGYVTSKKNETAIGYATQYDVYNKIESWTPNILNKITNNDNKVWIYNEETNSYINTTYDPNYIGDYYLYYPIINGTGIIKDIKDLNYQSEENAKVLYKLHITNDNISYMNLYITPNNYSTGNYSRTIKGGINESKVNIDTGEITDGVITNNSLAASFTYVLNWEILKIR